MEKENVTVNAQIDAPAQKIFDFITNPENIPAILPGLVENSNVPQLPLVTGSSFNYKYQMYGMNFDGVWTVTDIQSPTRYQAHTTGGIESDWTITIVEDGAASNVSLVVEYEIPGVLFRKIKGKILRRINEKEGELMIHNLKVVLEEKE